MILSKIYGATLICGLVFGWAGTQRDLILGNRKAIVYVPNGTSSPALVVSMHGMGIPAGMNQGMMQFEHLADTAKFIVAYPEAENLRWDLGSNKDIDFILTMVDSLHRLYNVDRNRIYATGFSMGGMMSWYLSCKVPDKIAAIVPGNGYPMGGLSGCSDARFVPALQIYGDADNFVSYSGFVNNFFPAQRTRYGCPATPTRINPYPTTINGRNANQMAQISRSFLETWNCNRNGQQSTLALLTVHGMIHDWATPNKTNGSDDPAFRGKPFDVNGTWEAWNWMKNHSLQGSQPEVVIPSQRDSIFNGKFDLNTHGWTLNVWDGTAEGSVSNGEYQIRVSTGGTNTHSIQLIQNGLILQRGKSYEIRFDGYSEISRNIELNIELDYSPWTSYLSVPHEFTINTTKRTFSHSFTMAHATDSNARIAFNVGHALGSVILDNIQLQEIAAPVFNKPIKYDMDNVFVNFTNNTLIINFSATPGKNLKITLYDNSGKVLNSSPLQFIDEHHWHYYIGDLKSGVYILHITANGKTLLQGKLGLTH